MECFVALAEELHFRRAAERCHLTQSAMSQQLSRLEAQLHVTLVHRTRRVVRLTAAGEVFLREARRTLAQMERAVALTRRTDRGEIGQLTVGTTAPALYILLPEIRRRLRLQAPGLGVVVHEMTTADQERALREGDIDVGLVHPPLDDPTLSSTVLAEPAFWAAIPAEHPRAGAESLGLEELAGDEFVLFPREIAPKVYDTIITACRDAGFSPRVAAHADPAQSIIAMVAAGFGIGFIAARAQRMARAGVVYRPFRSRPPTLAIGLAVAPGHSDAAVTHFMTAAEEVGRELS